MKKKVMAIYPSFKHKNDVKNHSTVCSYFLSKYLKKYYDIVNTKELTWAPKSSDSIGPGSKVSGLMRESWRAAPHVDYILSTLQRGFTKFDYEEVVRLKKKFSGLKIGSIHDHHASMEYHEDFLCLAMYPPTKKHLLKMKRGAKGKGLKVIDMGWCADHKLFYPDKNSKQFNVVIDHAALQDFRTDVTDIYIEALKVLKSRYPNKEINVCRLRQGFEFYDFDTNKWSHDLSKRWWSSKYDEKGILNGEGANIFQIAEALNSSHIFCITHVESCGLTGIEALMAGCKLYIPEGTDRFIVWGAKGTETIGGMKNIKTSTYEGTFLKKALLKDYMDYSILKIDTSNFLRAFSQDLNNYKNKTNRKTLIRNHSWKTAADRIHRGLEGVKKG
jgi:hypothetical protein